VPRRPKQASHLATALVEHSSDAITLLDETGTVLYANPSAAAMLGTPREEMLGSNVFRSVHEDDLPTFRANFEKRLARPGVPIGNSFRARHRDGTWRNIESVGVNRLHDAGVNGIIVNSRDVTDSRLAQEALQRSEMRFRRLVEHANDIIFNCDPKGFFTFVNPTALRLMKYSEEELLGRHFLTLIRPDYQERAAQFYARQRKDAIPSTYFEFPAVAKDGTELWVGQNVQIQYEAGAVIGIQAIARDITQRLALEEQLRQAQKMEAIGRLAGGVAHDFNNVLTAILGSADLLAMQLDPKDPRWEEADAIRRAADRGAALTRRLLAFSRPQRAGAATSDVMNVARTMEPMLQRLVLDTVTIQLQGHNSVHVRGDESQLSQVLMNLVVNARDAMPSGGVATIDITESDLPQSIVSALGIDAGRYGRISVSDTGEGMEPEVQRHLFEPFFTTKDPDKGSGLGLSIVYSIVKSLGGAIEVWSEKGQGAKFTIYLPAIVDRPSSIVDRP
jgi:two-component system, cell cycle sensor histidine kinase and response regulator CckA